MYFEREDIRIMKRLAIIIMMISISVTLSGCSLAKETSMEESIRAVEIQEIQESENPVTLRYIGTVDSKKLIKYSFKSEGRLSQVYVSNGDKVKKGDILAALDTKDLKLQVDAARVTLNSAHENIKKSEEHMNYTQELYDNMEELYAEGAISKDQYDQIKLQQITSSSTYTQSKDQYDKAKTDLEYKRGVLEEAAIYAKEDGIIVDVLYEEGERIAAPTMQPMPVVVLRGDEQIVQVGIAQKDLDKIYVGTQAIIDIDGDTAKGSVTNIDEAPDRETRTYQAEVKIEDKDYRLGSIAKVTFDIGMEKGVWIPINAIFSNGEDYVYMIKNDRAFKRTVTLHKNYENMVLVEGISPKEMLAVKGMKNLNDGSKVNIMK